MCRVGTNYNTQNRLNATFLYILLSKITGGNLMSIYTSKETTTTFTEEGEECTTIKETSRQIERSSEPEYIKLYTRMWCEFNEIPFNYRELFLQLIMRMSWSNKLDLGSSQTVVVFGSVSESICKACGWSDKSTLRKGLKALMKCNAIRRISRATYQINPSYAGKGEWKYNPRLHQGGVEDLVATFKFKEGTIDTQVVWADDGCDNLLNKTYREGLNVSKKDNTILSETTKKKSKSDELAGQFALSDIPDCVSEWELITGQKGQSA